MKTNDFLNRMYVNKGEVVITDTLEKATILQDLVKGAKKEVLGEMENAYDYALELLQDASNYSEDFEELVSNEVECYVFGKYEVLFVFPLK